MIVQARNHKEMINDLDWDFQDSISDPLHSIHPYPAKFIPDIPRTLIKTLPIPTNTLIFDPFCGSGVTLTEAQNNGFESLGVDLNPIACLLSKVKTSNLNTDFLEITQDIFYKSQSFRGKITIPNIPNLDHWFKKEIQEGVSIILRYISLIQEENILDALRLCLSSIIVKVSNQDSDTRYASVENSWTKEDCFNLFRQNAQKLYKVKLGHNVSTTATVLNKNSLNLTKTDLSKPIGLVITSPPYPNAYEYWLYHKYRMWWLGYDPIDVKNQEIGARAHYFKVKHQTENDFIMQMNQLFAFLSTSCIKNAFVCFVIGRSKIHGKIIENEKLIKEIGQQNGFKYITTKDRTIKASRKSFNLSHARIKQEFIVILKK